ncbi:MAG TPA: hypothetical protein VF824_18040 [Thermoanaerobaculia bacterium]|jgi:hypothetical protein
MTSSVLQYETNFESEAFFESLAVAARSGRRHPQLTQLAMRAARAALVEGMKGCGGESFDQECEGGALEANWEAENYFHQSYPMHEAAPALTLMEHLGHGAAEAESDGEAFAFLAPLLPMAIKALPLITKGIGVAAKMIPKIAGTVAKVAPKVMKGVDAASKVLRADPVTKPLVQAMPRVVQQTTADLARQVAQGKPISAQTAVQTLARNTANVLGNPSAAVNSVRRARTIDQRVHRALAAAPAPCSCQQ